MILRLVESNVLVNHYFIPSFHRSLTLQVSYFLFTKGNTFDSYCVVIEDKVLDRWKKTFLDLSFI